jgi:predicted nucleic acid-binding protein
VQRAAVSPSPTWRTSPYIALAEALDVPLLTRDRRLAAAAGHQAQIDLE